MAVDCASGPTPPLSLCCSACVGQGKRGIEKTPWQLPDFIAATGIEKLRQVRRSHRKYPLRRQSP